jgi:hypothetical protein
VNEQNERMVWVGLYSSCSDHAYLVLVAPQSFASVFIFCALFLVP